MKQLIATISLLLLPMTAYAEGWYAGIAGGSTDIDTGVTAVVGATLDETGSGTSFFIGKDIEEKISIEGFYTDLGEASLSGNNGDLFTLDGTAYQFTSTGSISISATTMGIAGKLKFDVADSIRGYVKGGLHSWEAEAKVATTTASATATTDGTDIVWGVGAEYDMGEKTALLLGYDNFKLDDETVTFLHAGILFKF
jgi:hypothetical protein